MSLSLLTLFNIIHFHSFGPCVNAMQVKGLFEPKTYIWKRINSMIISSLLLPCSVVDRQWHQASASAREDDGELSREIGSIKSEERAAVDILVCRMFVCFICSMYLRQWCLDQCFELNIISSWWWQKKFKNVQIHFNLACSGDWDGFWRAGGLWCSHPTRRAPTVLKVLFQRCHCQVHK